MNIVNIQSLRFRWNGEREDALHIPNMQIERGQHHFIHGPSGSGKTTLLNLIAGVYTPSTGEVEVLGQPLSKLSAGKRDSFRADHLGVIFQQFNLLPFLSVLENVNLSSWFSTSRRRRAQEAGQNAESLLSALGLGEKQLHAPVHKLSVGQQQRVAVARALYGRPEILIADEPTSALDRHNRERFLDLLFQQSELGGTTLLFVSHDETIAQHFEHRLELGSIHRTAA